MIKKILFKRKYTSEHLFNFKNWHVIYRIKKNVSQKKYNVKSYFDSNSLGKYTGVFKFQSEKGSCGLIGVRRTPTDEAYRRIESFTRRGGKLIYLPMYPEIPKPKEVPMYTIIGYASLNPSKYLVKSNNINLSTTDFYPIGRFYPMKEVKKKYDFLIVTWAKSYVGKRWDLVIQIIKKLCPHYHLCLLTYKGTPLKSDQKIINTFEKSGNLTYINHNVSKEEFPILLNSAKVLIVPNEWDNHPRIMDQALLCNVFLVVNKNIYGGQKLVTNLTGVLSQPNKISLNAIKVLKRANGTLETREWYLNHYGPYNATIKLTKFVNKVFKTNFKIIYGEETEHMYKREYIEKINLPKTTLNYFEELFNIFE